VRFKATSVLLQYAYAACVAHLNSGNGRAGSGRGELLGGETQ